MPTLTRRQKEILEFIEEFIAAHRTAPSYREICTHFGFSSVGSVSNHLRSLKKKGVLHHDPRIARSLKPIIQGGGEEVQLPLIGELQGGAPISLYSHTPMHSIPRSLVPHPEISYLLKVKGETLREEALLEGDLLIIEPRLDVKAGECVLALVYQTTSVVQRFFPEPPNYRFESSNPSIHPLILREDHVTIQGVIVGLLRNYT